MVNNLHTGYYTLVIDFFLSHIFHLSGHPTLWDASRLVLVVNLGKHTVQEMLAFYKNRSFYSQGDSLH